MKKKTIVIFCVIWILLEIYFIVNNYLNENPIATHVVLLVGFLVALYLNSGKDNVAAKRTESSKVKKRR